MLNTITAILREKELKIQLIPSSFTRFNPSERRLVGKDKKYKDYQKQILSSYSAQLLELKQNKYKKRQISIYCLFIYDVLMLVIILRVLYLYCLTHLIPTKFLRYRSYYFPRLMRKMNCGNNLYRVTQLINKRDMLLIQAV